MKKMKNNKTHSCYTTNLLQRNKLKAKKEKLLRNKLKVIMKQLKKII